MDTAKVALYFQAGLGVNVAFFLLEVGYNYGFQDQFKDDYDTWSIYFDFLLKEKIHWNLHTGVLVKSAMGPQGLNTYLTGNPDLDSLFLEGTMERKLSYFNVPILVRYKFKNELFI